MYKLIFALVTSAVLLFSSNLHARDFGGMEFPDKIALPGTTKTVQLNGIGYRKKFFIKVYIGALYTERLARSRNDVVALNGPNRVMMHIVHDEISNDKLVDAWNEGFEANTTEDDLQKLRPQIDKFNKLFRTVKAGDVIYLDYIPGAGTRVIISDENRGVIVGKAFNKALLDIWLGEKPVDSGLKKAMLGG